ncbi:hypothetical protein IEO21_10461 [Rhodonia placenta]|uniref:Uncharacterized protein n=1 Tax=Rhodonia placenta TaxID=104341 RepID=A0A8H7TXI3_9APHY|nr:hypothetical protein IEO21_10461 [Postia placenta]
MRDFRAGCAHWSVCSWSVRSIADIAPGAGESARLCKRHPGCAVHCHPI